MADGLPPPGGTGADPGAPDAGGGSIPALRDDHGRAADREPLTYEVLVTVSVRLEVTVTDPEALANFERGRYWQYWGGLVRHPGRVVRNRLLQLIAALQEQPEPVWQDEDGRAFARIVGVEPGSVETL